MAQLPDLIDGILPATEVSILAGASGAGKTTVLMGVLKQLQDNLPVFGHAITPDLKLGYIAADRTWDAYDRLAQKVGVDLSKMKVRALIDDENIDTHRLETNPSSILYTLLGEMAHAKVNLVVVDPLAVLLGCDLNTYHVVAARLIRLNRFCKLNNLTVLGTHHATKARSDYSFKRPQDRISGSSALLGFTSTQLFLSSPEESGGEYTDWHIVSHHAKAMIIHLRRNSLGLFEMADMTADMTAKSTEILSQMLHMIPAEGKINRKALIGRLDHIASPATIDDQLLILEKQGIVKKLDGGYFTLQSGAAH